MSDTAGHDLLIVGAGPCGIAAGVAAHRAGLSSLLVDKGTVADAVVRYPTYTTFFSGADKLEIGGLPFTVADDKPTRREAIRYFRRVAEFFELEVCQYEEVRRITGSSGAFEIESERRDGAAMVRRARNVVLATGYFDTPRRLTVPGTDLPKVASYFREPFAYYGQDVLVVGGGNSAADTALSIWREGGRVTLVHQFGELDHGVKPWVRPDLHNRIYEGSIPTHWNHEVAEIRDSEVDLRCRDSGKITTVANDWVLAMIGFEADTSLLTSVGVEVDPETGVPAHDPETMETNVPGVFIAGVIAAGKDANKIFIENGKHHGGRIAGRVGVGRKAPGAGEWTTPPR